MWVAVDVKTNDYAVVSKDLNKLKQHMVNYINSKPEEIEGDAPTVDTIHDDFEIVFIEATEIK